MRLLFSLLCVSALSLSFTSSALAHDATSASWSASPDGVAAPLVEQDRDFALTLGSELGLLSVMYNKLQQGSDGTYFDLVDEGGQDLFVPFARLSAEMLFKRRHTVTLLYQPIDLRSRVRLRRDIVVDERTFSQGTSMDLRYGFDFFRATYTFDLAAAEDLELSVGGGFQMRVAAIEFFPVDGSEGRASRDLGPVPLLKLRVRKDLPSGWFFGTEIDGFYANIPVANGDLEADVTGAIYDASLRAGRTLGPGLDGFLNVRFLGGGGVGTSPSDARDEPGDGYVKNWLHAATVSLGFYFEPMVLTR